MQLLHFDCRGLVGDRLLDVEYAIECIKYDFVGLSAVHKKGESLLKLDYFIRMGSQQVSEGWAFILIKE